MTHYNAKGVALLDRRSLGEALVEDDAWKQSATPATGRVAHAIRAYLQAEFDAGRQLLSKDPEPIGSGTITFSYRNAEGKDTVRWVIPKSLEWMPEDGPYAGELGLRARDMDRGADRTFAISRMYVDTARESRVRELEQKVAELETALSRADQEVQRLKLLLDTRPAKGETDAERARAEATALLLGDKLNRMRSAATSAIASAREAHVGGTLQVRRKEARALLRQELKKLEENDKTQQEKKYHERNKT